LFPHFIGEVFISFLELSCTFLAAVHSGDTLYPALTITGLEPKGDDGIVITAVTRPQPARATRAVGPAQVPATASAGRRERRRLEHQLPRSAWSRKQQEKI
jgi:acyl dehydratase